jgi:hypothetical protein
MDMNFLLTPKNTMKALIIFVFGLLAINAQAQKLESYKASNGVEYHIGDTIRLGRGSSGSKAFVYIQIGGIAVDINHPENNYLPATWSGSFVKLKKIQKHQKTGKIWFIVGGGNIVNYYAQIEEAIAECEVVPCKTEPLVVSGPDKFDQLKKLKELLDSGALTQEEYDKEKAKILEK